MALPGRPSILEQAAPAASAASTLAQSHAVRTDCNLRVHRRGSVPWPHKHDISLRGTSSTAGLPMCDDHLLQNNSVVVYAGATFLSNTQLAALVVCSTRYCLNACLPASQPASDVVQRCSGDNSLLHCGLGASQLHRAALLLHRCTLTSL